VRSLRELSIDDVGRIDALPDPWGKRARHVVTENARVLAAVEALESADRVTLGRLLEASHRSLRDDYQVSTEAVDLLVRALEGQNGIFGARITGGGFGASVVAVAEAGLGFAAALRAAYSYRSVTGHEAAVRVPLREVATSRERRMRLFRSFMMGGFECSTHMLRSGRRLDLVSSTRHDVFAREDYERMRAIGMRTARDGVRWHVVEPTPGNTTSRA
jgi:hypothetical protein